MEGTRIILNTPHPNPSATVKFYPDALMNEGSLYLFDASNPSGWDLGSSAPANGSFIPNIAWETAAALVGSGDRTSLGAVVSSNLTGTDGIIELTPKKGIHVIYSQATAVANRNFRVPIPALIRQYITNNPNRSYYVSMWHRTTRVATTNATSEFSGYNIGTSANDYLFKFSRDAIDPSTGGRLLGSRGAASNALGNILRNVGVTGFAGTLPATIDMAWKAGAYGHYATLELNKAQSLIFYRVYIEDLTASGRTYAQADVADLALYTSAFGTGGRFNGDTFTAPSTLP